jgi:LDH2 family malate/lactate/ureidoglycolate dehydrogenase
MQAAGIRVSFDVLRDFMDRAFTKAGLPAADARAVATLMAEAEMQGSDGHGAIRLAPYLRRIREGGVNKTPNIRIEREKAATALVHGDNGMGHLVMTFAAELAVKKARESGVAWVGAHLSNHAGPASLYARMALPHDMIGLYLAVGNANHLPAWGGLTMLLSTNPIACAIPTAEEPPVVLDMATTVAAYGKVKARAQRGETMPEGWMVDREGKPLLDPKRAAEGFLLPIGGHKGYGLALIIGLLAGTLNGAAMGKDVIDFNADFTSVGNTGQAICAIDPSAFGDLDEFKRAVDGVVRDLRASERMPGVERIWMPGEQSHEKREAWRAGGIPIPPTLKTVLDGIAADMGLAPLDTLA